MNAILLSLPTEEGEGMALQSDNEQTMLEWIDKLLEYIDTESVQSLREHDANYQEMQK